MKAQLFILAAGLLCASLTSCETTGDPRQGGLFEWSEQKAQGRIYQRQSTLNAIEDDTAEQRARGRQLQNRYDSLR